MEILHSVLIALIATVFVSVSSLAMVEPSKGVVITILVVSFLLFFILAHYFGLSDILLSFV